MGYSGIPPKMGFKQRLRLEEVFIGLAPDAICAMVQSGIIHQYWGMVTNPFL